VTRRSRTVGGERKKKETIKESGITAVRAGREKQRKKERKKKKKRRKDGSSRRVPDALSGFVCDLHNQRPDPSVFYSTSLTLTPFPWYTIA
jgi:hypothetical protein